MFYSESACNLIKTLTQTAFNLNIYMYLIFLDR